jgi:hypothetical protein
VIQILVLAFAVSVTASDWDRGDDAFVAGFMSDAATAFAVVALLPR